MSDTEKTIDAIVKRDFNDAGTSRSYEASDTPVPIAEGEFVNFLVADLVEFAPVIDAAPTVEPASTKGRKTRG